MIGQADFGQMRREEISEVAEACYTILGAAGRNPGFLPDSGKELLEEIRDAAESELSGFLGQLASERDEGGQSRADDSTAPDGGLPDERH